MLRKTAISDISYRAIAQKAGVTHQTVGRYFSHPEQLTIKTYRKIAAALDQSITISHQSLYDPYALLAAKNLLDGESWELSGEILAWETLFSALSEEEIQQEIFRICDPLRAPSVKLYTGEISSGELASYAMHVSTV